MQFRGHDHERCHSRLVCAGDRTRARTRADLVPRPRSLCSPRRTVALECLPQTKRPRRCSAKMSDRSGRARACSTPAVRCPRSVRESRTLTIDTLREGAHRSQLRSASHRIGLRRSMGRGASTSAASTRSSFTTAITTFKRADTGPFAFARSQRGSLSDAAMCTDLRSDPRFDGSDCGSV